MFGYDSAFIGGSITLPSFKKEFGLDGSTGDALAALQANIVSTFQGGCFFDAARLEYDSRNPGPVRDAILDEFASWSKLVTDCVKGAQRERHIDPAIDPEQLAFELDAIGTAANLRTQMRRDNEGFERARRAIDARLEALVVR